MGFDYPSRFNYSLIFLIMDYNVYLVGVKGVTPADKKFIEKIMPNFEEHRTIAVNPFSRERFETNPLVANLVTFIQNLEYSDFSAEYLKKWGLSQGQGVQAFDRARVLILKLDPGIYSNVID